MANAATAMTIVAANGEANRIISVGMVSEDPGGGDSEGAGIDVPGELPGEGSGPPIPPAVVMKLISPVSAHSLTWTDPTRYG